MAGCDNWRMDNADTNTMSDTLRRTIREAVEGGRATYKGLERDTGVARASIQRFVDGVRSLRLDRADLLAAYFGLELRPKKRGK
jgi:plasmid maintenance system antidote protein VapI